MYSVLEWRIVRIKYLWPAIVEYFCRGGLQARGSFSSCPIGIEYRNENQNCDSAMFSIKSRARIVRSDIPSCSSFNARKMISYIHARISENQSNIEILIHDNSTPFLLRDTRAFLPPDLCPETGISKGKRGGPFPGDTPSLPSERLWSQFYRSRPIVSFLLRFWSASIKSTWSSDPPIEIGHHQQCRKFSLLQFKSNSLSIDPFLFSIPHLRISDPFSMKKAGEMLNISLNSNIIFHQIHEISKKINLFYIRSNDWARYIAFERWYPFRMRRRKNGTTLLTIVPSNVPSFFQLSKIKQPRPPPT